MLKRPLFTINDFIICALGLGQFRCLTASLRGAVFFPVLLHRARVFIWDEKNIEVFLQLARLKVFNNKLVLSKAGQVGTISRIPKQVKNSLSALCWFSGGNLSVRALSVLLRSQHPSGVLCFFRCSCAGPGCSYGTRKTQKLLCSLPG